MLGLTWRKVNHVYIHRLAVVAWSLNFRYIAAAGKIKTVEVADLYSKKLVNSEKAIWVIGGDKKGVMTWTAIWAFAKKDGAAAFVMKNGGTLATYKEALAAAEKE